MTEYEKTLYVVMEWQMNLLRKTTFIEGELAAIRQLLHMKIPNKPGLSVCMKFIHIFILDDTEKTWESHMGKFKAECLHGVHSDVYIITRTKPVILCSKCDNPGTEDHPCPYAQEIHDDHDSLCNCCDDCTRGCAMDV